MTPHFERAQVLLSQGRHDQAAQELRQELADNPDNPYAHALLALSLTNLKRLPEAEQEARVGVHLAPDAPFPYFALACVLEDKDQFREAEAAIREALRLEPDDADYFARLASIQSQQERWADALASAEAGLHVDPDDVGCANLRALCLVKLNRREEAGATLASALAKDPENATTHANQGWAMLHQNQPTEAMEHFKEALRLDPNMEWARQGILESLRARNPIYRVMLGYFLWMARLPGNIRTGVLFGGYFAGRILNGLSNAHPSLAPLLLPVLIVYYVFVYLTWTARPLFNLLLRLDKVGRLALTREQTVTSNWFGGTLLAALLCLVPFFALRQGVWLEAAMVCALMTVPVAVAFGRTGRGTQIYAVVLGVVGLLAIVTDLFAGTAFTSLWGLFGLAYFGFLIFANVSKS